MSARGLDVIAFGAPLGPKGFQVGHCLAAVAEKALHVGRKAFKSVVFNAVF